MESKVIELENGLKQITEYHPLDKKTVIRVYTIDSYGKKQGSYESYWGNGQLEQKCTYKDDKLDGVCEHYYGTGELHERSIYQSDKGDGVYEIYFPNGKLQSMGTFKNGFCCLRIEYNKDGQLMKKELYKNRILKEDKLSRERRCINNILQSFDRDMEPTMIRKQAKENAVKGYRKFYPHYCRED